MFKKLFGFKTKRISSAALILAASSLVSAFLGIYRNRLLASTFGASAELDAYFAAFRLPDFIYSILIAGGIVVAFLPLFGEYFEDKKEKAWEFVNNVLDVFLVLLILISLLFFIFTPFLVDLVAPGFEGGQKALTILLTRIMFLSPILLGLSSVFSGVLQYFDRFLIYSLSPIFYNLGIIGGILFLTPEFGILGVAFGVIGGALLHLLIQLPAAFSCGFNFKWRFNFRSRKIKKLFYLMIPRTAGVAAQQINILVMTAIASILATGSVSIFNFAKHLYSFPIRIAGISFAISAFPTLSKAFIGGRTEEFKSLFLTTFKKVFYLATPAAFMLFLLRSNIVNVVLRVGEFGIEASKITSATFGILTLALLFAALVPLLFRAFFALKDTLTPTLITIGIVILNIILAFSFINLINNSVLVSNWLKEVLNLKGVNDISILGLASAFALTTILQFFLFLFFLKRKINYQFDFDFVKILGAGLISVLGLLLAFNFRGIYEELIFGILFYSILYFGFSYLFGLEEPRKIIYFLKTKFTKNGEN